MTIEEFKEKIHTLQYEYGTDTTELLQDICEAFLKHFYLEVSDYAIFPTEVEAYCYCTRNPDLFVHRNILQKNRFGYLYVHRHPDNPNNDKGKNTPKGRAGIDVCLSDNDDMYFGMLIRSALVTTNNVTDSADGPFSLYKLLKKGHNPDYFKELESSPALKAWGNRKGYVFFSPRIGLPDGRDDSYAKKNLRAVIADTLVGRNYKMKEDLFSGLKLSNDEKSLIAKDVLGYLPSYLKGKSGTIDKI